MNFSDTTFEALAAYERHFDTAITGGWCSNPGRAALTLMHDELDRIDGHKTRANLNCSSCVLTIVKRVGYLYFADKGERANAAAAAAYQKATAPKKTSKKK